MKNKTEHGAPNKESNVNDRFNHLVYEVLGSNPPKIAKLLEKDIATIRNITGGPGRKKTYRDSSPSFLVFYKLKNAFPNISVDWLTTGEGTPLIDDSLKPKDKPKQQKDKDHFVNENLKMVRVERKLSQREFAEMLGVSEAKINGIENNKASATFEILRRVRKNFGISYDMMIDGFDATLRREVLSEEAQDAEKLKTIIAAQERELAQKDSLIETLQKTVNKFIGD
jgi:transcriptional regulator with XRE-family HTH domain